jgi:hypothetical protein
MLIAPAPDPHRTIAARTRWRRWRAWYPVRVDGRTIWMRTVWRRDSRPLGFFPWTRGAHYRAAPLTCRQAATLPCGRACAAC